MYILEKKWKKHDLITAVDYRYSSFFFFFFEEGKKCNKNFWLFWLGEGKGRKASPAAPVTVR